MLLLDKRKHYPILENSHFKPHNCSANYLKNFFKEPIEPVFFQSTESGIPGYFKPGRIGSMPYLPPIA